MRQSLGDKKKAKCEAILGRSIRHATVRGGTGVCVAQCWVSADEAWYVDYRKGAVLGPLYGTRTHPDRPPPDPVTQQKLDQMKRLLTEMVSR